MKMAAEPKSENKSRHKMKFSQDDRYHLSEDIIANAGVAIYIVQHGKFVYVSELYQKVTGYTDKELINTPSLDYIYSDDREMVRTKAITCLKIEDCEPYEYRFVKKNKEIIWVLETVTSIEYRGERAALGSFMDITERKHMEEKIRNEERLFRAFTEKASDIIVLVNREKMITYENPAIEAVLGLKVEERIGKHVLDNIHPEDRTLAIDTLNTWMKDKNAPVQKVEIRIRHIDGSWHTFESMATNLKQDDIDDTVIVNLRDITERKWTEEALRQSEEKYRSIIENIQEGYFEIDLAGNFTFYNDSVSQIIGYSKEELMGMNYRRFTSEQTAKQVFQAFNKVYNTGNPAKEFDWQIIRKDGAKIYIEVSVSLQKDLSGKTTGFKGIIRDITERKQIDQQLTHMASHDALTGLPNRMLFMDRLDIAFAQSRRSKNKLAVMMLDLDHFKDINDTLGHMVGDKLLQEVGNRLTGILRHNDTVARLGGDEFIVLLSDIERIEDVIRIAKVILKAFQKPFLLSDHHVTSNASIGIAVYPDDCQDIETLLKKSDMAMYSVKTQGRNGYQFFSDVMSLDLIN